MPKAFHLTRRGIGADRNISCRASCEVAGEMGPRLLGRMRLVGVWNPPASAMTSDERLLC